MLREWMYFLTLLIYLEDPIGAVKDRNFISFMEF